MLAFLGKKSIAATIPILAQAMLAIDVPGLVAKLAGLVALGVRVSAQPPSIAGNIKLAADISAGVSAAITPPSVSLSLDGRIPALQLTVDLLLKIQDLLLASGIHVYSYSGTSAGLGDAMAGEFGGTSQGGIIPPENVYAVTFIVEASNGASVTAVKTVFGTE